MCRKTPMLAAFALLVAIAAHSGEPMYTPQQLVEKSIAHHDPRGVWHTGRIRLRVQTTYSDELAARAGDKETTLSLTLSPHHEEFGYVKEAGADTIDIRMRRGQSTMIVNGSADVSEADKERLRLREAVTYRDYCEYLYGMPMKLEDPGTILAPTVGSVRFNDREVWQLKVTYDPDVGGDTWYFYFDPETAALVGCRFYHDESKNDGEYIVFAREIVDAANGLRLPQARAWYTNADDKHLATDTIASMSAAP